jgi:hypothetical protein
MTIHSYAIRSNVGMDSYGVCPPEEGIQLGPYFRLERVIPGLHLEGVLEKFKKRTDFGKFAPFRDEIWCELVADEKDWAEFKGDKGEKFSELSARERLRVIQGHANAMFLLLRLRGMVQFTVPVELHGSSFRNLKTQKNSSIEAKFRFSQALLFPIIGPGIPQLLNEEDIEWILKYQLKVIQLNNSGELNFLHDLFDIINFPNPGVQLIQIWAAIEALLKPKDKSVRRSLRYRCAMILGNTLEERKELNERVGDLYDFRSKVVHGGKNFSMTEYLHGINETQVSDEIKFLWGSFDILKRLVIVIIESGIIPTEKQLQKLESEFSKMDKK